MNVIHNTENFLGGGSTKECDHDCDQALIKSYIGVSLWMQNE